VSDFPANDADDLELKKRARRRLVGAVALALLAVILLPLAMDDEVPPAVPDMQVSVPTRNETPQVVAESEPESAKVDIEPDAAPGAPEAVPSELPPAVPEPQPVPESLPLPSTVAPEPPPLHAAPAQPVTPPAMQPPPSSPAREKAGETRSAARDAEAGRALALLSGAAVDPAPKAAVSSSPGKKVFVQVGSFGNAARAAALASELKKQGFAAYAEKAGNVNRVRVGPLSRSEGGKVAARLKAKGHAALLVSR
jgi:DedD protein